jgi:hypothetical protein
MVYLRSVKKLILFLTLLPVSLYAQIGGRHVYDFLNLTPSARVISLGGVNVSTIDEDVNFGYQNPALVTDSMHKHVSLSFANYLADIGYGYASYSQRIEGIGNFHSGVHYVSYGKLQGADEFGNLTGEFNAGEFAWVIGLSRAYKRFHYGANLKFISSTLATGYTSTGLAVDLGASYYSKDRLFSSGLVVRNIGTQLSTYTGTGETEPLPFEVIMGMSVKLKYMPLRFSITATNLEHPNLIFEDPSPQPQLDLAGNLIEPENVTVDNIFRHFVFGGEFLLGNALRLRAGYNHLRRQELRSENRAGLSGFSLGAGLRINRLAFDYGYSSYGANSVFNAHLFSLSLNLQKKAEDS